MVRFIYLLHHCIENERGGLYFDLSKANFFIQFQCATFKIGLKFNVKPYRKMPIFNVDFFWGYNKAKFKVLLGRKKIFYNGVKIFNEMPSNEMKN